MPSIKMDNGTTAEELEAAIAADNGTVAPAPTPAPAPVVKEEAPAPKAKAKASKPESKLSE